MLFVMKSEEKAKNLLAWFEETRNGFVKANNKLLICTFFYSEEKDVSENTQNICCLNVLVC